ncbi:hypothetical protein TGAMA5MH_04680 [Trichoderma gamsii]|uniref:HNH nuclease domain-containing protein n=1 Tax=Trichoderma gamsii TaxID=398673 RepID=A0A2K0TDV0_9HYPO|nr:hypothetical protein TGAMA5MH_04680 [Trichoderma gamsii]
MSYSEALTLPNLRGKLRQEVSQQVDRILEDLRVEMYPLTLEYQTGVKSTVKHALHNKKKELAAVEKLIRILHVEYHAGHLDTADEELCLDRYNLERRGKALNHDTIVLRTSGQGIGDRIHDDKMSEESNRSLKIFTYVDEAYLDSLIAPYKTPEGAKIPLFAAKDEVAEKKFRRNVLNAYDAKRDKLAWCVVSGRWHKAKHITTFAIVRHGMGEPTAQHLFGPPDSEEGHLMGAKNGLPMHRLYAESFHRNQMVLVPKGGPDDDQGSFSRWKILFWDRFESDDNTAKSRSTKLPWGPELSGRELQFSNQVRPDTRYLFLHYCIGVLDHQKSEAPGWWRTCFDDLSTSESPKIAYLRASTLRRVARMRCPLNEEEAAEFAAHSTFPRTPDDSDEGQAAFEAVDDETMDVFLADVSNDSGAPRTMSPLSEESHDSMDAIEIDIDGVIEVQGEDSEGWDEVDGEDELGDKWVDVDEDVDEYAHDDEDGGRHIFKTAADQGLNFLANILRKKD